MKNTSDKINKPMLLILDDLIGAQINMRSGLLPAIMNIPLKDGGRVTPKGIGKAKRGFGRAMRKK